MKRNSAVLVEPGHSMNPRLAVGVQEAAEALGVSVWTIREYVATGELPTLSLPATKGSGTRSRRVLIAISDLEAFVERCRGGR